MNKTFINTAEAAKLLGISKSTLYKMTCKNKIPFYRPAGKLVYFKLEEIQEWMENARVASAREIQGEVERYCRERL